MLTDAYAALVSIPTDALKAIGGVTGTALAAGVVYAWNRIRAPRATPDAPLARMSMAPEDRDLGFTLVRTGTDLTRALHEHGEILKASFQPAPPPLPTRRIRTRP